MRVPANTLATSSRSATSIPKPSSRQRNRDQGSPAPRKMYDSSPIAPTSQHSTWYGNQWQHAPVGSDRTDGAAAGVCAHLDGTASGQSHRPNLPIHRKKRIRRTRWCASPSRLLAPWTAAVHDTPPSMFGLTF
eukprot:TRINITY_DN11246_c0_g1_i1.p1 TRINITY_DN11246_c0_g1~~TRINITY_DN11246_c0_g1_i1.p1  ORF type:complete len:133 (-),score=3.05 TRINITY_DN11246_c0_g1_i1:2-400(-)